MVSRFSAFGLMCVVMALSLVSSASAATRTVDYVTLNFTRTEIVQISIFNNDTVTVDPPNPDVVGIRLYNTRHELVMELERTTVPRGEVRTVDIDARDLTALGTDRYGRIQALVELTYSSGTTDRADAAWQTSVTVSNLDGKTDFGLLLPAVRKLR